MKGTVSERRRSASRADLKLVALMASAEKLLSEGFEPER